MHYLFSLVVNNLQNGCASFTLERSTPCFPSEELTSANVAYAKSQNSRAFDEIIVEMETQAETLLSVEFDGSGENVCKRRRKFYKCFPTYCYYCQEPVKKFSRHLLRRHRSEKEVREILSKECSNKQRKCLLVRLRKKGNFLASKRNIIRPVKRKFNSNVKLMSCNNCMGFYSTEFLVRHRMECSGNVSNRKDIEKMYEILNKEIFPLVGEDEVGLEAKRDVLICAFGARKLQTPHGDTMKYRKSTCIKMRQLSKMLITLRNYDPSITDLTSCLQPKYFDFFVVATKEIGQYDAKQNTFKSPIFVLHIGPSLKHCCTIALSQASSPEQVEKLEAFIEMFRKEWNDYFPRKTISTTKPQVPRSNKVDSVKDRIEDKLSSVTHKRVSEKESSDSPLLEKTDVKSRLKEKLSQANHETTSPTKPNVALSFKTDNAKDKLSQVNQKSTVKLKDSLLPENGRIKEMLSVIDDETMSATNPSDSFIFEKGDDVIEHKLSPVNHKPVSPTKPNDPPTLEKVDVKERIENKLSPINDKSSSATELNAPPILEKYDVESRIGDKLSSEIYKTISVTKPDILLGPEKCDIKDRIEEKLSPLYYKTTTTTQPNDSLLLEKGDFKDRIEDKSLPVHITSMKVNDPLKLPNDQVSQKGRSRIRWTQEQKMVVRQHFRSHIENRKPPTRKECEEFKQQHSELLHNKDWFKLKVFVTKEYSKMRR